MALISKAIVPFLHNQVEMVKHDLTDFPPQPRGHGVRPRLLDVQPLDVQPQFALDIAFFAST
jgi:hypothetical protein